MEASELLELFQWKHADQVVAENMEAIKEELADVLIYSLMMADNLNLDVEAIIADKLALNAQRYSIAKSKGSNKKYKEL